MTAQYACRPALPRVRRNRICRRDEIDSDPVAAHSELAAWLMPTEAQEEWLRLSSVLDGLDDAEVPCRAHPQAWWPDGKGLHSDTTAAAVAGCYRCPARAACLGYAVAAGEREGVWGGLLPRERREIKLSSAA